MSVILIFLVFVLIDDTAAVGISYLFERISNSRQPAGFLCLICVGIFRGVEIGRVRDRALCRSAKLSHRANRFQSNVNVGCAAAAARFR
jgi:hypothetical protein